MTMALQQGAGAGDRISNAMLAPRAPNRRSHPAAYIRGLPISCVSRDYVLSEIGRTIDARENGHFIVVTNPEIMYHGLRVPSIGEYIRNSDLDTVDNGEFNHITQLVPIHCRSGAHAHTFEFGIDNPKLAASCPQTHFFAALELHSGVRR